MAERPTPPPEPQPTVEYVTRPAPPAPDAAAPVPGQSIGDYELIDEIARGGQGVVYLAREGRSGRLVALKKMLTARATSPTDLSRFMLEAQSAGELNHPGIVAVHAWGLDGGHPYYTMDFVPGRPLHKVLAAGRLPVDRAVRYLLGTADALATAHARGIVHRDLKPSNIMIDEEDQPRVLDFGLAKRQGTPPDPAAAGGDILEALPASSPGRPASPLTSPARAASPITEHGAILGTPSYMAPEQVRRDRGPITPAADVHALGAIAYEMLAGRPPFVGESTYSTLMDVLNQEPAPLSRLRPDVPPDLAAAVHRCLDKDPRQRYPDAAALAEDLQARYRQAVASRRYARLTGVAAGALLVLALVPLFLDPFMAANKGLDGLVARLAGDALPPAAALVLDTLLYTLAVIGAPVLAGGGLVAWTAAWVWHAPRPGRVALLAAGSGLGALAAWTLLTLAGHHPRALFLPPWLFLVAAATAVGTFLGRHGARETSSARPAADPGGSYLQKLFTVRGTARPRKAGLAGPPAALADFEPGKLLHSWETGDVHWARQLSLDRPVLLWRAVAPAPGGALPGVVVDHPAVLRLHALGSAPQGRLLVTEAPAATPLRELLGQRRLVPEEAVALAARLAHALQAFHDQGAVHGRLSPDWVLVRGDLEPLLCPCGVPGRDPGERQADLAALAALLLEWLPRRPRTWRWETLAPVYHAADLAAAGDYARPLDFALDLEQAARVGRVQWRERLASAASLSALLVPWAALVAHALHPDDPAGHASPAVLALVSAGAAAALLAYAQARWLVAARRLRGEGRDRLLRTRPVSRALRGLIFLALAVPLGVVAFRGEASWPGRLLAWLVLLTGYAAAGLGLAAAVTFAEFLVRSLRPVRTRPDYAPEAPE